MLAETGDGSGTTQSNSSSSQLALNDRFVIIATDPAQQAPAGTYREERPHEGVSRLPIRRLQLIGQPL